MPDETRQSLPDHSAPPAVVYIARCPEHGLHGERDECFVCAGPVENVTYVRGDMHLQVSAANGRKLAEIHRLRRALREIRDEMNQPEGSRAAVYAIASGALDEREASDV